jgi:hypothetical protein
MVDKKLAVKVKLSHDAEAELDGAVKKAPVLVHQEFAGVEGTGVGEVKLEHVPAGFYIHPQGQGVVFCLNSLRRWVSMEIFPVERQVVIKQISSRNPQGEQIIGFGGAVG